MKSIDSKPGSAARAIFAENGDALRRGQFEDCIQAFEAAWRAGRPVTLKRFLADLQSLSSSHVDRDLLLELIAVELELRWRENELRSGRRSGPRLETYLKRFPQLGALDDLPLWLVAEEYRARRRWGDAPAPAEYAARCPRHGAPLQEALAAVDDELRAEGISLAPQPLHAAARYPVEPVDPEAPLFHDDYLLRRLIGTGGMCKVYTGVQRSLDRAVAVKVLKKSALDDPRCVRRFLREARIAARLRHPSIVAVHGLGRLPDGGYFLAMDLIEGEDLARRIAKGPISPETAAQLIIEAAEAVAVCHEAGVLHCDLKPSNFLVDAHGRVHLTDFGLARWRNEENENEPTHYLAGTAAYMAPEQIDPWWGKIAEAADIYGLGGVLYTLLAGRPPFQGDDRETTLARVASAEAAPAPSSDVEELAWRLNEVCLRCLAKKPQQRYSTARELAAALRAAVAGRNDSDS